MKKEISGLIGDYDWRTTRNMMVDELMICENEIDFIEVIEAIYNSIGTPKQIERKRKKLGLKGFSEKDKKFIEKMEKYDNKKK